MGGRGSPSPVASSTPVAALSTRFLGHPRRHWRFSPNMACRLPKGNYTCPNPVDVYAARCNTRVTASRCSHCNVTAEIASARAAHRTLRRYECPPPAFESFVARQRTTSPRPTRETKSRARFARTAGRRYTFKSQHVLTWSVSEYAPSTTPVGSSQTLTSLPRAHSRGTRWILMCRSSRPTLRGSRTDVECRGVGSPNPRTRLILRTVER